MPIELSEINEDDDVLLGTQKRSVGCIVIDDDENWIASNGDDIFSGHGIFDTLDTNTSWMVNKDFQSVKVLQSTHPELTLKINSWMRILLEDIAAEWGITSLNEGQSAKALASVLNRINNIAVETILNSTYSQNKNQNTTLSAIDASPSLATGLRKVFDREMEKTTPSDTKVRKRISEALIYGAYLPKEKNITEDEIKLSFQYPRLSHALRVAAKDVPAQGKWQKANFETENSLNFHLNDLVKLDLPMIITGTPQEKAEADPFLQNLVKPNTKSIKRLSYTLDEVIQLSPYYDFEDYSVIVGPGWRRSTVNKVLSGLMHECGGRDVASASWSAGLVAENILCGGFRKLNGTDAIPPECIWLTSSDRLEMHKGFQALSNYGATLITAYAGRIDIKCPNDPEIISLLINAAWESGLIMPIYQVFKLNEMGIEIPLDLATFGGAQEDVILAQITHQAQRNAMWVLDDIQNLPKDQKKEAFKNIFG